MIKIPEPTQQPQQKPPTNYLQTNRYNKHHQYLNLCNCVEEWSRFMKVYGGSLEGLVKLQLSMCKIDDYGASLIGSRNWPSLQCLHLDSNQITSIGLKQLINKPYPVLNKLKLWKNNLADEAVEFLLATPHLPELTQLNLGSNNSIKFSGFGLDSIKVIKLKKLVLMGTMIGSKGIKIICKANLPLLEQLELNTNNLTSQGHKHLTKGNWANLTILRMSNTQINHDGCSIFYLNNFYKLKTVQICWALDRTPLISLLEFMAVNWKSGCKIFCAGVNRKMEVNVKNVLRIRFLGM